MNYMIWESPGTVLVDSWDTGTILPSHSIRQRNTETVFLCSYQTQKTVPGNSIGQYIYQIFSTSLYPC